MTLTIGRFSDPKGPTYVVREGDDLDFGLSMHPTSQDEAEALRHQLLGLTGETQTIPVTFTDDPIGWDGHYFVDTVQVEDSEAWFVNNGVMRARVRLRKATRQPAGSSLFEVSQTAGLRTNTESVTTSDIAHRIRVPYDLLQSRSTLFGGFNPSFTIVPTATGSLVEFDDLPSSIDDEFVVVYSCTAQQFYNGGSLVEFSVDNGSTWWGMHGTRVFPGVKGIRISNGLLRLSLVAAPIEFKLQVDRWDGSQWRFINHPQIGSYRASSPGEREPVGQNWRVLRNRVEGCAVRLLLDFGQYADISIDRSHVHFEAVAGKLAKFVGSDGFEMWNDSSLSQAGTAINGGVRKTTFTAQSHKWAMVAPDISAKTVTTPCGIVRSGGSSSSGFPAQFGYGVSTDNNVADVVSDYFASHTTTQRLIR